MSHSRIRRNNVLSCVACFIAVCGGCSLQDFSDLTAAGSTNAGTGGDSEAGTLATSGGTAGLGGIRRRGPARRHRRQFRRWSRRGGGQWRLKLRWQRNGWRRWYIVRGRRWYIAGGGGGTSSGAGGSAGGSAGNAGAAGTSVVAPDLGPWNFDTAADTSAWTVGELSPASTAISWTADGESNPLGALVFTATGVTVSDLCFNVPSADANQSNRQLNFRVRSQTGLCGVKAFAMSNGWTWADGGVVGVTTSWSTVSINISTPSYSAAASYDPTEIIRLGLETATACTIEVDRAWLQ